MTVLRSGNSLLRALPYVLPLASVVLVAVLGMLLVWVLAIVPVDRLRKTLLKLQWLLAGVVGDSYVFLQDAVQRRAIIDRVRRDVEWLSQRCRKVVVVAHSQGAAVADQAVNNVREYRPEALRALITLGAGVQTLERLRRLRDVPQVIGAGWLALGSAALLWTGLVLAGLMMPAWFGAAGVILGALGLLVAAKLGWDVHPGWFGSRSAASIWPWHDFYASRDPVPMGPLTDPRNPGLHYRPHEVVNRESFLHDHTSYWRNPEQVVGPLVSAIAAAAEYKVFDDCVPDAAALRARLARSRDARIVWLQAARWVAMLGGAWLAWCKRELIADFASWAPGALGLGAASPPVPFPGWGATVSALSVLLPWLLYAGVLASVWEFWGESERRGLLENPSTASGVLWPWLYSVALASVPTVVSALTMPAPWLQILGLWLAGSLLCAGAILVLQRRGLTQS